MAPRTSSTSIRNPAAGRRFAALLPEPGHLWIRYAPRGWEGPERPWLDLATGRIGRGARRAMALPESSRPAPPAIGSESPFDDLVYLPPVPRRLVAERDDLARRALAGGAPVLVQLLPGDPAALPIGGVAGFVVGAVVVIDLLAALLEGELEGLEPVPDWVAAGVWPLLPGVTDDPGLWERGCRRLAAAGLRCVQAVVPMLAAGDRRRLAQGLGERAYDALFHRQPPVERDFARVAHRHGLTPFLARPLPRPPLLRAENRRVAGLLALAAELWLRVGRPVEQAQSLFRAGRWLDATAYDVGALRREGNLAVVKALDPLARQVVAESADAGEPALLAELLAEYLGSPLASGSLPAGPAPQVTGNANPAPGADASPTSGTSPDPPAPRRRTRGLAGRPAGKGTRPAMTGEDLPAPGGDPIDVEP